MTDDARAEAEREWGYLAPEDAALVVHGFTHGAAWQASRTPVLTDRWQAWDDGFEAGSGWSPGHSNGMPIDPPQNPYRDDAAPVVADEPEHGSHGAWNEAADHGSPVVADVDADALWQAIADVRDASPRTPDDADTWDIVEAVLALLRGAL